MLRLPSLGEMDRTLAVKVYLATGATDMRKGFDSLAALVRDHLGHDPLSGSLFLFVGRGRERLLFEGSGGAWLTGGGLGGMMRGQRCWAARGRVIRGQETAKAVSRNESRCPMRGSTERVETGFGSRKTEDGQGETTTRWGALLCAGILVALVAAGIWAQIEEGKAARVQESTEQFEEMAKEYLTELPALREEMAMAIRTGDEGAYGQKHQALVGRYQQVEEARERIWKQRGAAERGMLEKRIREFAAAEECRAREEAAAGSAAR